MGFEITDEIKFGFARLFQLSDGVRRMPLPKLGALDHEVQALQDARDAGDLKEIRASANALMQQLASVYKVPPPRVVLQRARPIGVFGGVEGELYGRYDCRGDKITLWAHTAVKRRVVAFKTMLGTLTHEFCHYLDRSYFYLPLTVHSRGFYQRRSKLYARLMHERVAPGEWLPTPDGRWRWAYAKPGRPRASLR